MAASASLMLSSPARPSPSVRGERGGRGDALSELEGTTSSKPMYAVSDVIDCSDVSLCFGMIGGGSSICVRRNCTVAKHASSKFPLVGTSGKFVFIRKNVPGTVFSRPSLSLDKIPPAVRADWSTKLLPLPDWTLQFRAVDNTCNDTFATEEDIKEETLFLSKAELLKTPAKRKRDPDDDVILGVWQGPKLERTLPSPAEDLEAFIDIGVSKDNLIKAVAGVESNVHKMNEGVTELASLTHNRFVNAETNVDVMMGIIQSLKSRVGEEIEVDDRCMAPTLWGTTSFISDEVIELKTTLERLVDDVGPMKEQVIDKIKKFTDDNTDNAKNMGLMITVVKDLMEKMEGCWITILDLKNEVGKLSGAKPKDGAKTSFTELLDLLGEKNTREREADVKTDPELIRLRSDVNALKASLKDDQAIKFAGLGLRDANDATDWVEANFSGLRYGLIMDPLLMLERIYGDDELESGSFLKSMETRHKLKIDSAADAAALNALKHSRPRIFHKGRPNMVNLPNKSRLNLLSSHKEWRSGGEGVEQFIITKMNVLYSTISADITTELGGNPESMTAHYVATKCLTATVTFITQLIAAVNSIYERLFTFSKFTTEQTWSLTTQVLDRVMSDLYQPKDGVFESLSTTNPVSTCGRIVWASFRTHEVMASYVAHQFENHPAISTEYVKFLATNSGSEKVVKLTTVVETMPTKLNTAATDASKAGSKADSCSAKTYELLKEISALTKRVKALEDKGGK